MSTTATQSGTFGVLYVDVEEQALKYFRRGLEKDFTERDRWQTRNAYWTSWEFR